MGFFLQLPLSFAFPVMPFLTTCFLCCFHLKWHSRHFRFCWKVKASIFEESLICILANDSEGLSSLDVCHFERDDSHLSSLWSLYIKMLRQSKQILVWRRVGVQPPNSHRVSSNTLFPCQLSHEVSRRFVIAKLETRFALCVTGTLLDRLPLCGGFLIWSFADPRSEMSALVSEKRDGKTLDLYDHWSTFRAIHVEEQKVWFLRSIRRCDQPIPREVSIKNEYGRATTLGSNEICETKVFIPRKLYSQVVGRKFLYCHDICM
jgi:hypothetical protein